VTTKSIIALIGSMRVPKSILRPPILSQFTLLITGFSTTSVPEVITPRPMPIAKPKDVRIARIEIVEDSPLERFVIKAMIKNERKGKNGINHAHR
jgi:hypothetical protein